MQKILALIVLLALGTFGVYYYFHSNKGQNPEAVYGKALSLPGVAEARAYLEEKVKNWEPDPEDPEIKIPKNWGKSEVAAGGKTFVVYSPDQNVPPRYYISFGFPKELIKDTPVIKCWGTAETSSTDVCMVGNNPVIEAYFQILKLVAPDWAGISPKMSS